MATHGSTTSGMDGNGLSFVDTGSWVWYKHADLAWAPCKVTKGGRDLEIENAETREKYNTPADKCYPMHESSLTPVSNMVELADLNEASILHNLRSRYTRGDTYEGVRTDVQMFTYIGPIMIYINPYKSLPIFTPKLIKTYYEPRSELAEKLPPHAYEVVNNTYLQMRRDKAPQSMVISGESGAGKTEATKICLNFLAEVAGSKGDATPTTLLLDSSPIMESFGNAKTVRNNNSSRFGKYMEVHFQDMGSKSSIVGGDIKKYLLEKSRIVWQAPGERNYHVFVEIFDLPPAMKAKYELTRPEDFFYINQGGSIRAEGWDDKEELNLVRAWLAGCVPGWLRGAWLAGWLAGRLAGWLAGCLRGCLAAWLRACLPACVVLGSGLGRRSPMKHNRNPSPPSQTAPGRTVRRPSTCRCSRRSSGWASSRRTSST
eukprot:SAG22_NODE_433_length_10557_cov_6.586728_1_plen_430_part_00